MSKFFIFVGNELRKIFVQKSFIILLILLFIPIIVLGRWDYVEKQQETLKTQNWKTELTVENQKINEMLAEQNGSKPSELAKRQKEQLAINSYRLKHNISTVPQHSMLDFIKKSAIITSVIGLLLIYFASSMMSKEHQWKTINFLLVKPTNRSSIFFSKFISIVCLYFIFSFAIMLYAAIIGSVLYGVDFHTQPDLSYVNGQVVENSVLPGIIYEYLINFLPYLFFASIAYFLSTVLKSSSISLLIGIVLLASSDVIATVLRTKAWSKFLPFMHTDLSVYSNGINIANGMKIEFSVLILLTYILLFLLLACFVFKKRDIV